MVQLAPAARIARLMRARRAGSSTRVVASSSSATSFSSTAESSCGSGRRSTQPFLSGTSNVAVVGLMGSMLLSTLLEISWMLPWYAV